MSDAEDFKRKLDELAKRLMEETDPEVVGELVVEMDLLWRELHSKSPPEYRAQKSPYAEEALRMHKPTSIDMEWGRAIMGLLKEGSLMVLPNAKLQYRVHHGKRQLVLMNVDQLNYFDSFVVHLQTIAVFHALDYEVMENRLNIQ